VPRVLPGGLSGDQAGCSGANSFMRQVLQQPSLRSLGCPGGDASFARHVRSVSALLGRACLDTKDVQGKLFADLDAPGGSAWPPGVLLLLRRCAHDFPRVHHHFFRGH
jgi:hypothetical protein